MIKTLLLTLLFALNCSAQFGPGLGFFKPQSTQTSMKSALVAYWAMDEASTTGALDSHSGGKDLSPGNSPGITTGNVSGARSFVAASLQSFSSSDDVFNFGDNDWSISLWVKLSTITTHTLVCKYGTSGTTKSYLLQVASADNKPFVRVSVNGTSDAVNYKADTALTVGAWGHVILTYNHTSDQLIFYVNGTASSPQSHSGGVYATTSTFYLGTFNAAGNYLNGNLDEVAVFNKTLSLSDVAYLYNSGSGRSYSAIP